jgi:hypothetical protein
MVIIQNTKLHFGPEIAYLILQLTKVIDNRAVINYNNRVGYRGFMDNPIVLEECYQKYIQDIQKWIPDGITYVDLNLLHKLDLLNYHVKDKYDPTLTRYFHVIESEEKITLFNEDFVVWIVPEKIDDASITYTLIALNQEDDVHLEMAFATSGVYNNSRLVLRILEKFLFEIQENEDFLRKLAAN